MARNQELETLQRFNQKVARLESSGFAKRYAQEIPQVVAKFEELIIRTSTDGNIEIFGQVRSHLENFDQDEIDAFVLTHRILTQNNDPLSIASLAKLYAQPWMPEEARARFNEARAQLNIWLKSIATVQFENRHIGIGQLAEIMIYGGLAHSNQKYAKIFENWTQSGMARFFWAEFFAYSREMLRYFRYFRDLNMAVIQNFSEADKTKQAVPTKATRPVVKRQ